MSSLFATNENIDLLWEIILEEEFIRKVVSKEKIVELGGDYLIWSNAPENPILN
jgi:hypothetical protein